ncbi:Rabenosyn-5 [Stylophora pistillata]|uniref:Rabenosyn-5 n=1 Tax=Stylophora pistillata TaxID=50429 RepID=A0A2B4RHF0_STYPI|nr:Rabenosyn-5 [Stylophora pistillata]
MENDDIKEGFICPMCMKDLGNASVLQRHFEESHSDDKDALRRMREAFGKAKRKIINKLESSEPDGATLDSVNGAVENPVSRGVDPFLWDQQDFGISIHLSQFRYWPVLSPHELLRSGVTVKDSPALPTRPGRKSLERRLVPWIADSEVKSCPLCKKQFNLARRRHHCRLCGGIMCAKCSVFVSVSFSVSVLKLDQTGSSLPRRLKGRSKDDSDEAGIRACQACMDCLERYDRQEKEKKTKPPAVQLYEKMKSSMTEAELLQPTYTKMADSINKKIAALGTQAEKPLSPQAMKLQRGIRAFATGYLQENMFTLPNLPPVDKISKLQEERAKALARKAAEEKAQRERAMQERLRAAKVRQQGHGDLNRNEPSGKLKTAQQTPESVVGNGWGPVPITQGSSPDPMLQQMDIIKSYIVQARQQKKYDEVEMLERNLMELEEEYFRQHQGR